jgi:outer membrane protein OmpA-like peptidoglycan-associated protein
MKHVIRWSTGVLAAGMLAAGCSTAPSAEKVAAANTAIGNAGQAIDQAAADPHVAKYANTELERASDSLGKAKAAWSKHDLAATTHNAYLAQHRAALAQELANERAAHDAVTVAAANRDHAVAMAMGERPAQPTVAIPGQMQEALPGFAFGKAKLPPNAKPAIDALANTLKENPGRPVVIAGHTDSVGSPEYNHALAMKRAAAVRAELVRRGVESSRITLRSEGEQNPVASNDTEAGRRENRRAEVIIPGMEAATTAVGSSEGSTSATSSGGQNEQKGEQRGDKQGDQRDQQRGEQQGQQQDEQGIDDKHRE